MVSSIFYVTNWNKSTLKKQASSFLNAMTKNVFFGILSLTQDEKFAYLCIKVKKEKQSTYAFKAKTSEVLVCLAFIIFFYEWCFNQTE